MDDRRDTSNSIGALPRRPKKKELKDDPGSSSEGAALKTPRRVIPSLVDVSSSDKVHLFSRRGSALADRALLVFYDCARETSTNKLGRPAQDSARRAAVRNVYNNIDLRQGERVHPMPFSPNVDRTDTTHQRTRSVKLELADV